jgi:hypothetical protein
MLMNGLRVDLKLENVDMFGATNMENAFTSQQIHLLVNIFIFSSTS